MATLGERLKILRKEKRLTQVQLAEFLKQTPRAYQYCEAGEHAPEFPNLIALADFYDVSLDYLVGRDWPKKKK